MSLPHQQQQQQQHQQHSSPLSDERHTWKQSPEPPSLRDSYLSATSLSTFQIRALIIRRKEEEEVVVVVMVVVVVSNYEMKTR
ncbi:hypothetical protein E2C01_062803 [Portunus trituberculatus]|uniref:Uncharacterized protein n=1 Tax=Portunus trituberculatus TaxID=210409 RepID=A0A5B7H7I0_PORTR|nr:hypothetical protein [Portunus trituberculatus]